MITSSSTVASFHSPFLVRISNPALCPPKLAVIAPEVKVECVNEKGSNPIIKLSSSDKQLLGHVAAKIRSFRMPEPYKWKGIKFVCEQIRRKAGKSA